MATLDPKQITGKSISSSATTGTPSTSINSEQVDSTIQTANKKLVEADSFTIEECKDNTKDGVNLWNSSFKEIKTPSKTPNQVPIKGAITPLSPPARGIVCGTGTHVANLNIGFECNFVTSITIDTCFKKFELTLGAYIEKMAKLAFSLIENQIPGISFVKGLIEAICQIANEVQRIVCFLQQVMACILGTIGQILKLIAWVVSLPIQYMSLLVNCVTSFFDGIVSSLSGIMTNMSSVFTVLGCQTTQCESVSNFDDIIVPDSFYSAGNAASKVVGTL